MSFQADIGELDLDVFEVGELVIKQVPPKGKHIGPARPELWDWERAFWATGLARCPLCLRDVWARVEIRNRRFAGVTVSPTPLPLFGCGYIGKKVVDRVLSANEIRATELASRDWGHQQSRYHYCGTIATDQPLLAKGQLFYPTSTGCERTAEGIEFCRVYNETLNALVVEHGVPDWSPGKRLPDRHETVALLGRHGTDVTVSLDVSAEVARQCEWIQTKRERRGATTVMVAIVPDRDVVLLGGDRSERASLIDVVDARNGLYMASYEYPRRHVAVMPWDASL